MRIEYTLNLFTFWHCSSGLNAGAEADILVLKDEANLPYIPGKTIKGLLKDAMIDINEVQADRLDLEDIHKIFGQEKKDESGLRVLNTIPGDAFFSDATLHKKIRDELLTEELTGLLYKTVSSTAIESSTGVAKPHSLRTIEVCIPLQLQGHINSNIAMNKSCFEMAFKWTRHLGTGRNRGLGRCQFKLKN